MAAALSVATPAVTEAFHKRTVTGTGFTASTPYIVTALMPSGFTTRIEVTSDGSGGFSFPFVFQARGTVTFSARPATEWTGTTTAAATATATVQ
jgi:hypothetical protein